MSCHSTSGGLVSTSLARAVTGLSEKEVQHIFHALKREAAGMPAPSELQITEWRARQYDLLSRCRRMSDTRMDKLRDRLFRTRGESVPDGPTFHAWSTVEARARQEVALRGVDTAVDLAPPGSQAHLYDLGEDGRPKRVWYASYGSNLHRDRFLNYIKGGQPEGSSRTYDGCTDDTEPAGDIPIRFAGARPHFALTSRVWHGGIAFIDAQKGESAHGLGRAYDIAIDQFDEVVAQENGQSTLAANPVSLDEALATGRSEIGNGSYETILHIGDYEGAPVLTFTAPFSTREALTGTGHITRKPVGQTTPVRMPVMTNKPSPAYLRMIGSGLAETFGMDETAQADYLRGCPGGDRWSRQQMVRILRGQSPDPERAPGPENPRSKHAKKDDPKTSKSGKSSKAAKGNANSKSGGKGGNATTTNGTTDSAQQALFSHSKPAHAVPPTARDQRRRDQIAGIRDLPGVKTYASYEEKQDGTRRWHNIAQEAVELAQRKQEVVTNLNRSLDTARARNTTLPSTINGIEAALTRAEVEAARAAHFAKDATEKYEKALNQRPERYYRTDSNRTLAQWKDEDNRLIGQQRVVEQALHHEADRLRDMQHDATVTSEARDKQFDVVSTHQRQLDALNARLQETYDIIRAIEATPPAPAPAPSSAPAKVPTKPNGKRAPKQTGKPGTPASSQPDAPTSPTPKNRGKNRNKNTPNKRTPGQTSR
jgi:hypothetical protein